MEQSGGEPDVVGIDTATGAVVFMDCSAQSPKGRRSVCYDREALDARKEHKPKASAVEMADAMGAVLLTGEEYRRLQELGQFDTTTSSWVQTPAKIRQLGGELFCARSIRRSRALVRYRMTRGMGSFRCFRWRWDEMVEVQPELPAPEQSGAG